MHFSLKKLLKLVCFISLSYCARAQGVLVKSLSTLDDGIRTANAPALAIFNQLAYLAWTSDKNDSIAVITMHLAEEGEPVERKDYITDVGSSIYAPQFITAFGKLYLFWVNAQGGLSYRVAGGGESISEKSVFSFPIESLRDLDMGLSVCLLPDQIVLSARNRKTHKLCVIYLSNQDGIQLHIAKVSHLNIKPQSFASLGLLPDTTLRVAWNSKKDRVYFSDFKPESSSFSTTSFRAVLRSNLPPALFKLSENQHQVCFWKESTGSEEWKYANVNANNTLGTAMSMFGAIDSKSALMLSPLNNKEALMAYTSPDKHIVMGLAHFYNPSRWMEDFLYPDKSNYTLKDIVLPGSHDAGMSVLTASGGRQGYTINECNTLTQKYTIRQQLEKGFRMFDLRVGRYDTKIYTKHASSDCMDEAIGGGFGESLSDVLKGLRSFMEQNTKETVILTFSHFCEKEAPPIEVAKFIRDTLGASLLFQAAGRKLSQVPLKDLSGKVLVSFENYSDAYTSTNTIEKGSDAFINFRREYAATNNISLLQKKQHLFFNEFKQTPLAENDLVRLDWQLTQSSEEAAMACNDFQTDEISPLVNGMILLTNIIRKHRSIRSLALVANASLYSSIDNWIGAKVISHINKPNILYTDMSDVWITNYCIQLNNQTLYQKQPKDTQ